MIVRRIHIENFGHFHDFTLELAPGLNRLRGANEFGKTTLLEFVRRVMWGYPDGRKSQQLNRYPARFNAGEYGGFLELELADGTLVKLERYGIKGKAVVRHADGGEEDGETFFRRLTQVSGDCYRNVYAVTLDELAMLSSLDGDEIRGRLYGGAITGEGVSLPKLGKYLDERAKALYKQRSAASEIGAARQKFRDACERRDGAVDSSFRRSELERELAELEKRTARLAAEAAQAAKSAAEADALLKAHPHFLEYSAADRALAELPPGPDVPEAEARRAGELEELLAHTPTPPPPDATRRAVLAAEVALLDRELAARGGETPLPTEDDLRVAEELGGRTAETAELAAFPLWIFVAAALAVAAFVSCLLTQWHIPFGVAAAVSAVAAGAGWYAASRRRAERDRRAKELERSCADFRNRLSLDCPPEEYVAVLRSRLRRREAVDELAELQAAQNACDRAAASKRELDDLCRRFGCADSAGMRAGAQRSALANDLKRRRAAADAALAALLPPEKRRLLAEFDPEAARAAKADSAARRAEAENAVFLLHQKAGALANELEHLPHEEETELLAAEVEQAKGELRKRVREYLVVRTCRALLDAAVDRYERESQPEVFKRAEKLFSDFTEGRYTRIYKKLATGELTVCDTLTGLEKTFGALSRGTREELMLAMRLGLIECTERDSEPLPVCFDDVGVNFDPERLRRVEAAVADFASGRQVLWFSHS